MGTIAHNWRRVKAAANVARCRCVQWVVTHPRTGWWFAVLLFVNYLLDLVAAIL